MAAAIQKQNIYIYSGFGANPICVEHTQRSLERHLDTESYTVIAKGVDHSFLRLRNWERDCAAVVFPGGSAIGSDSAFNIDENYHSLPPSMTNAAQKIKKFLEDDNKAFLGICSGAFIACKSMSMYEDQLIMKSHLQLTSLTARGFPYFPKSWSNKSYQTAKAASIQLDPCLKDIIGVEQLHIFWNGGPYFYSIDTDVFQIGFYMDAEVPKGYGILPQAIIKPYETGGRVILSGVHFELNPEEFLSEADKIQLGFEKLEKDKEPREKLARYLYQELGLNVKTKNHT